MNLRQSIEYKALYISRPIHDLAKSKAKTQGRSVKGYIERLIILDRSKN